MISTWLSIPLYGFTPGNPKNEWVATILFRLSIPLYGFKTPHHTIQAMNRVKNLSIPLYGFFNPYQATVKVR